VLLTGVVKAKKCLIKLREKRWWVGHVLCMLEMMKNAHKILIGKPEGKRPLGRPRCIWEEYIKLDLEEMGREGVD
jgi:hypothetical protein